MKKFDSEYSFVEKELDILKFWEDEQVFQLVREKNKNGKKYRFIDGPITANNPMGIHHVWGRTLKDTFLRYKSMNGYTSHYRNGFDGQGLWVEVEVEKELGFQCKKDIEDYGIAKFTEKCMERVRKCSDIITEQSKRLGQWMDWENSYFTNTDTNITSIWKVLKLCNEKQWIKKIHRPMAWCPRCGTSLSEHEMSGSYKEINHEAVFFKLPVIEMDANILVWTTTPWTLSSNVALAVNEDVDYIVAHIPGEEKPLIMAKAYYDMKFSNKGVVKETYKGKQLVGLQYETCFEELPVQKEINHRIVSWDQVQENEGCGVVHIAPGCGAEDFDLGQREKLDVIAPINEQGTFYDGFGFLSGKSAQEVKDEVFEELRERGKLFYHHEFTHSYPVCWRCKHEILFRLVEEWAIDVNELRPKMIKNARKVNWNPEFQGKRMENWLTNMGDWCISRSRYYGLPLPFYECQSCKTFTVVGSREELKKLATNPEVVDQIPHLHRPYVDEVKIRCPQCHNEVQRVTQVGDVWLDAGIVPFSTLKHFEDKDYWKEYFPAEFVIEMKEQIRLWFYSMLFMSTVLEDAPPYEQVGTHGMVTAEDGSRFSKTGFMIRFDDAAAKIGADASRYLFAASSMSTDVRFGYNLGNDVKKKLLNYWNLSTFFVTYATVDNIKVDLRNLDTENLRLTDRWLLMLVNAFVRDASASMDNYNTRDLIQRFEDIVDQISNFYIRANRRRFWKSGNSTDKENAYIILFYAIETITKIMAPIIPFVTEHVWQEVIREYGVEKGISIHLSNWPKVVKEFETDEKVVEEIHLCRNIIALALRLRNEKQIKIRQKLNEVFVYMENKNINLSEEMTTILLNEANLSKVTFTDTISDVVDTRIKLNFKKAGAILKSQVNHVNQYLKDLDQESMAEIVKQVNVNTMVHLNELNIDVPVEVFELETIPKDDLAITKENGIVVALDTVITEELRLNGILRDILRMCQVARKKAGFEVNDQIDIQLEAKDWVTELLKENKAFVESELLAKVMEIKDAEYEETFTIEDVSIKLRTKRR